MRVLIVVMTAILALSSGCSIFHHSLQNPAAVKHGFGYAPIENGELYYEVLGSGPPILFLHAGIADSRMWDEQVEKFSKHFTVIRCDLRGYGKSKLAPVEFRRTKDISDLLDFLGIDSTYVVGISFGGRTAIDFALTYPNRVCSLILGSPDIGGAEPTSEMVAFSGLEDSLLQKNDLEAAADLNLHTWLDGIGRPGGSVSDSLRTKVKQMLLENLRLQRPAGAKSIQIKPPAFERLEEICKPTLIIIGDKDIPSFQSLAETAYKRIPKAKKVVIKNSAHLVNMEQPVIFDKIVIAFLKGI